MKVAHYAEPGEISCGTLREEDLLRRFATELETLLNKNNDYDPDVWEVIRDARRHPTYDTLELLEDLLNEFSPEGYYFGTHPGDGACFGFWLQEDVD